MNTDVIRIEAGAISQVWRDHALADVDPEGADEMLREVPAGTTCAGMVWSEQSGASLPPPPPELRAKWVKKECSRRILAVGSQHTQMNLAAARAAGRLSQSDAAIYDAGLDWIDDMRAACADLIADAGADYASDSEWPSVPAGLVDLCERF